MAVQFALRISFFFSISPLDPDLSLDPDPGMQLNADTSRSGSTSLLEVGAAIRFTPCHQIENWIYLIQLHSGQ